MTILFSQFGSLLQSSFNCYRMSLPARRNHFCNPIRTRIPSARPASLTGPHASSVPKPTVDEVWDRHWWSVPAQENVNISKQGLCLKSLGQIGIRAVE
jgi:hypothetical protein